MIDSKPLFKEADRDRRKLARIIDAHTHLSERGDDDALARYASLNELKYDMEELLRLMRENEFDEASCSAHR